MREWHNIVRHQQWIPQLNRGRREYHVVLCISLTPSSTARENSYLATKARESINSVQPTHSKIVNQPMRAPTIQSSIVSSDGVSEIEKFVVNLVLVISEYSTRLRKNHKYLRGLTPMLAQQHQRVTVRALCCHTWYAHNRGIQWARATRRSSNTHTREHGRTTSRDQVPFLVNKPRPQEQPKQSWDDFPRSGVKMSSRLNRQHHLNWRHIRNQPLLFSFSSVVVKGISILAMKY